MTVGPLGASAQTTGQTLSAIPAQTYFGTVRASDMAGLSYGARGCIVEVSETAKRARVAQAGEVLVRLDDRLSQLALRTARARVDELAAAVSERQLAVASARADNDRRAQELTLVQEEFQRNSVMFGRGLINETTMETVERRYLDARFAADRAEEAIANAQAAKVRADIALEIGQLDVQTAEINLDELTLTAPFDGVLVGFEATVGDCVQDGARAAQIYAPDQKSIEIYFLIGTLSATAPGGVAVGREVTFTRVNGDVCKGAISHLDTEADLETQYVEATIDVDPACAPALFLNEAVEVSTVPVSQ
ncbi:hypothetical protein ATO11_07850 [Pseudaestuariivita atlantica]|uniref:RND efflux pump membrane fusion protein barrel-sandwich domain-containing protein n=2 Tax=Pseudaestuariivita atlantica TaxID=1317121 RepID=A0A0L1JQX7_9RHOB|nr:hypothetical protein ATO11_07850 [Pseudaestuariivita atlantica]